MTTRALRVVNTLGELTDINLRIAGGRATEVSARSLQAARSAGLVAVNVTVGYVSGDEDPGEQTRREFDEWDETIACHGDSLQLVVDADGLVAAEASGRVGVIYGFQNARQMGPGAALLEEWFQRGVRISQLTYNDVNAFGAGSSGPEELGLTREGRTLVEALNERRIMVDLSHSNLRTCLDAVETTSAPVCITHTGARALADVPRNKTDGELRAVADGGGYVGVYFMPFLAVGRTPTTLDVVRHVEHLIDVCGEDHVGIGTDGGLVPIDDFAAYDRVLAAENAHRVALGIAAQGEGPASYPFVPELTGPDQFRTLAALLAERGHSGRRLEKLFAGNFIDYARRVWA